MAFCISPGEKVSSHCPREINRYSDVEGCSVIRIWAAGYPTSPSSKSASLSPQRTDQLFQVKTVTGFPRPTPDVLQLEDAFGGCLPAASSGSGCPSSKLHYAGKGVPDSIGWGTGDRYFSTQRFGCLGGVRKRKLTKVVPPRISIAAAGQKIRWTFLYPLWRQLALNRQTGWSL